MANSKPSVLDRLYHIKEAIAKIFAFTEDMNYEQFHEDELRQLAVIKLFEIIGEASYKIDTTYKQTHSQIEWSKLEGLRHVLVHDYYRIDSAILWNTKEFFLDDLRRSIEELIEEE